MAPATHVRSKWSSHRNLRGHLRGQAYDITICLDGGSKLNVQFRSDHGTTRRVELEGGLYHVIARGNNREDIFHSDEDHKKFLSLHETLRQKLPFSFLVS